MIYVFDLDGTLIEPHHFNKYGEYDFSLIPKDRLNIQVAKIFDSLQFANASFAKFIFVTDRPEYTREDTMNSLNKFNLRSDLLLMRMHADNRWEAVVKMDMLELIQKKYSSEKEIIWFDDNLSTLDNLKEHGVFAIDVSQEKTGIL